jgi:hypothetical protein
MKNKRDATSEETEKELLRNCDYWNRCNPNFAISLSEWKEKETKAIQEGYKDEVCGQCGSIFLAFQHFTTCNDENCPMNDGQGSILDRLTKE